MRNLFHRLAVDELPGIKGAENAQKARNDKGCKDPVAVQLFFVMIRNGIGELL